MNNALQDAIEPDGVCFGCGASSPHGLRLKSYPADGGTHTIATIVPDERYCGWPGLVYGGFLAMLVDCHSNWTAIYAHYKAEGKELESLPRISCVTAHLGIQYKKPTPLGVPLRLKAWVDGEVGRKTRIICEVYADSVLTVQADSIFARVNPDILAKNAHGGR